MTVDLLNYRMVCGDKAWKCRESGHSEACYRRDPRLQAIADAWSNLKMVTGERAIPFVAAELRATVRRAIPEFADLLDALTENNDD